VHACYFPPSCSPSSSSPPHGPSFNFAPCQATGNDPYHTLVSWLQRPRQAMKARSGARHSSCPSKTDCWSSKVPAISTCAYETWLIDICVYVALLNCECIGICKLQAHSNLWHGSFISVVSPCDLCMCVGSCFTARYHMHSIWSGYGQYDRWNYRSLLQNVAYFIGLFCTAQTRLHSNQFMCVRVCADMDKICLLDVSVPWMCYAWRGCTAYTEEGAKTIVVCMWWLLWFLCVSMCACVYVCVDSMYCIRGRRPFEIE